MSKLTSYLRGCAKIFEYFHSGSMWNVEASNSAALQNANSQNKTELAKLVEEKTDQIRKENKDFYKELESTIKIKLDENKSQIKQINPIDKSTDNAKVLNANFFNSGSNNLDS